MRCSVYLLTFFTYATIHMMRMTYSFNKHNIQTKFGIGDMFLGMMDSLMFITLSIGTLLRYSLINDKRKTLVCLKTAIPTALAFSVVPLVSLMRGQNVETHHASENTYVILLLSFGLFGFCQFSFFPSLITIFSRHFNVKSEGSLVGIWSSKSNVGNIIGFFFANFFVYQLHLRWQITMIFAAIVHLTVALLLQRIVNEQQDDQIEDITTGQLFGFLKQRWSQLQFRFYILSFSFFKAILYSYQLWTPQFLVDVGYKEYSGYVPMVFDMSTLLGSFFMGRLYEQQAQQEYKRNNMLQIAKSYKFTFASMFILVASILYLVVPSNIVLYFLLAVFMGMFLGGVYNSLENSEILSYAKNDPRETDLLSTANIALGCALVGVFQFVIGMVIYFGGGQRSHHGEMIRKDEEQSHSHRLIYAVIAVLAIVAMGLTFARARFVRREGLVMNEKKNQKEV